MTSRVLSVRCGAWADSCCAHRLRRVDAMSPIALPLTHTVVARRAVTAVGIIITRPLMIFLRFSAFPYMAARFIVDCDDESQIAATLGASLAVGTPPRSLSHDTLLRSSACAGLVAAFTHSRRTRHEEERLRHTRRAAAGAAGTQLVTAAATTPLAAAAAAAAARGRLQRDESFNSSALTTLTLSDDSGDEYCRGACRVGVGGHGCVLLSPLTDSAGRSSWAGAATATEARRQGALPRGCSVASPSN